MDPSNVTWRKARKSSANGGDCIEVAGVSEAVAIRDSKDPDGPVLVVNRGDFRRVGEALKKL